MFEPESRARSNQYEKLEGYANWQHGIAMHHFLRKDIQWREWDDYIVEVWQKLGLTPHRGLVVGETKEPYGEIGCNGYTYTYKGLKKKLERFNYEKIDTLSLSVLHLEAVKDLDVDEYITRTRISSGWRSWSPDKEYYWTAENYFLIKEDVKPFELSWFIELASKFHQFTKAQYGYYFRMPKNCRPESFVSGDDDISTNIKEYMRVKKWRGSLDYHGLREELPFHLRDIFRLNFLTTTQLDRNIDDKGTTLKQWINQAPTSERGLLQEASPGFYSWYIEDAALIPKIRDALTPSGIIICTCD